MQNLGLRQPENGTAYSPEEADAIQLAEAYRKRWTIEGMFLEMTETLSCEIDTLGYPKAALFAFCLSSVDGAL